jgi:hypothetical protein
MTLASIVPARAAPVTITQTSRAVIVDSTTETLLVADLLTHYIAVKKALRAYWKDPAHAALHKTADATKHTPTVHLEQMQFEIDVFDYPALVKQDSALMMIFAANHFAPEQFEATQIAAFTALGTLVMAEAIQSATSNPAPDLPSNTTTLGKNVELVKAHRDALWAVGVGFQGQASRAGVVGSNKDLEP